VARGTKPPPAVVSRRARTARWSAATALAAAGASAIAFARAWRGMEATLSAGAIHLVTGETAIAVPARHSLILYKSTSVQSIFVLTSECSVAYLVAALLLGSAPLMLLRPLSPWRTGIAVLATAIMLTLVNMARLTATGATVSQWVTDLGFAIAHIYLGSLLTVLGTCAAGVVFAAILVGHRRSRRPAVG
jgi:hypothetical protein